MNFSFAEVRLYLKMVSASRLLMLSIHIIVLATALVHSSQCMDSESRIVMIDQPSTVSASSNSTVHIPVRYEAASLFSVYSLSVQAHLGSPESIFGEAKFTSSLNNRTVFQTFQGTGILLLYGFDFVNDAHEGCLEINLKDPDGSSVMLDISIRKSSLQWQSPLLALLFLTAAAVAVIHWAVLRSEFIQKRRGWSSVARALKPTNNMLEALVLVALIEILGALPGYLYGFRTYTDEFLAGNQDACNFDFRNFYVYDIWPALNSIFSHYAYFAGACVVYISAELEANTQYCFCGRKYRCQHWQLGRVSGITIVLVGIKSIGYHLCPTWSTVPLDYSGSASLAFVGLSLLYQQRMASKSKLTSVCIRLITLTSWAYLGSLFNTHLWFKITGAAVVLIMCYYQMQDVIEYLQGDRKSLEFSAAPYMPYSNTCNKVAAIVEAVCGSIVLVLCYVAYISDIMNFALAFDACYIASLGNAFLIELALRISHSELTKRAWSALGVVIGAIPIGLYLFQLPNSEAGKDPWQSRADSQPAMLGLFDPHDLWHIVSGVGMTALWLLMLFFADMNKRKIYRKTRINLSSSMRAVRLNAA